MDPSIIFCNYQNSFSRGNNQVVLHTYTNQETNDPIKKPVIMATNSKVVNTNNNNPNNKNYDPLENVSFKPFVNRDALTLANLDMVFYLSKHENGYMVKQTDNALSFVTLDDSMGFAQYLLYKNTRVVGYGTVKSKLLKSCTNINKYLDPYRFNLLDITELNPKYKNVVRAMKLARPEGVDLVISNDNYFEGLITALSIVKPGGKAIFKTQLNNEPNELGFDLLYITSLCFDKITLFKPLSTDINNDEYFIVAERAKLNNTEWITYLSSLDDKKNLYKLLDERPKQFNDWVAEYNNLILMYKNYINKYPNYELYDTYKCKAIWNL